MNYKKLGCDRVERHPNILEAFFFQLFHFSLIQNSFLWNQPTTYNEEEITNKLTRNFYSQKSISH